MNVFPRNLKRASSHRRRRHMKRLNVIGCGRVGQTLARLWFDKNQVTLQDLHSRNMANAEKAARFLGAGSPVAHLADMRAAEVWMLSVPDSHIAHVAQQLADTLASDAPPAMAFHCSGFLSAQALAPLQAKGWQIASVHPVLNFAAPETGIRQFAGTPCALEGSALAVDWLRTHLSAIGGVCFDIDSEHKALYHAAAVFCSNFTGVLQGIAQDAWHSAGVSPEMVQTLNRALLQSTTDNLLALGPAQALTGPAARRDTAVVNAQAAVVEKWNPVAAQAYRALSELAVLLKQNGTTLPESGPDASAF
jgi:predicted short-subunit dehydrogenase-like oxidoreductase (DUF2520 family)